MRVGVNPPKLHLPWRTSTSLKFEGVADVNILMQSARVRMDPPSATFVAIGFFENRAGIDGRYKHGATLELSKPTVDQILLFAIVGDEIQLCLGKGLEFLGAFCTGKVVTDPKGVAVQFVDAGKRFAHVRPFYASDGHGFRFGL